MSWNSQWPFLHGSSTLTRCTMIPSAKSNATYICRFTGDRRGQQHGQDLPGDGLRGARPEELDGDYGTPAPAFPGRLVPLESTLYCCQLNGCHSVSVPGEIKTLMLQLLSGVEYLHDNWILHRDIKSSEFWLGFYLVSSQSRDVIWYRQPAP